MTVPVRKGKITLTFLVVAVSLSIAIEIGFATALTQGYSSNTNSYKPTLCTGKVL